MDADARGLGRDVEPTRDVGVGLVGDDAQLDGAALAVGQLGERRGQVVVEPVEPGWVNGGRARLELEPEAVASRSFERPAAHGCGKHVTGDPEQPGGDRPLVVVGVAIARQPGLGERLRRQLDRRPGSGPPDQDL